jgi:hypothetical protein
MSPQGWLRNDDDWARVPLAFAKGSPVLVLGSGCDRVGFDGESSEAWAEVTRRVRLLHHEAGADEKLFLAALWESKLSAATMDEKASIGGLPPRLDLQDEDEARLAHYNDEEPLDKVRIVHLAAPLLSALVGCTQILGEVIGSGTVPVLSWNTVIHPLDGNARRTAAANNLTRVSKAAGLLGDWSRTSPPVAKDRKELEGMGFDEQDLRQRLPDTELGTVRLRTLQIMKIGAIHTTTRWLATSCLLAPAAYDPAVSVERLPLTGAMIEWLADLVWHVIVCDTGVPHSQAELAFYINLRGTDTPTGAPSPRSFTRALAGEHRASSKEDLTELIAQRMERGATGCEEEQDIDWENDARHRVARTLAASLMIHWKMYKAGKGRLPVAIATTYDLVLERQLLESMRQGQSFHILVPVMKDEERAWLWGTYKKTKGTFNPKDLTSAREGRWLSWDWYEPERADSRDGRAPQGPVIVKLNGSPLIDLGGNSEASVIARKARAQEPSRFARRAHDCSVRLLCIFSEYDSLRTLMALQRAGEPTGGTFSKSALPFQISQAFDWKGRSWLFLGDRFPDWIPRLRLLLNAETKSPLTSEPTGATKAADGEDAPLTDTPPDEATKAVAVDPVEVVDPREVVDSLEVTDKIAIDRHFDWPERALLDALDVYWYIGDLATLADYPNASGDFFEDVYQLLPWRAT